MKKVNKDYISVVRSNNGKLHFERIPMVKSDRAKEKLVGMADDDRTTIEDMLAYLQSLPVFKFLALPYFEINDDFDLNEPEDWHMHGVAKELKEVKTKVKFLEKALELIEECDYRWNVIRITNSLPDILVRSHSGYENTYLDLKLSKDASIVFDSSDLGCDFDGILSYTVYKNNKAVLPYRSVVQLYECSDDFMTATKVFDPEEGQWDNALRSLVTTANVILANQNEYFKKKVIEDGQIMLEKIKQLTLDPQSYYTWLENIRDYISVDFSECDKTMDRLDCLDDSNKHLYELYVTGKKVAQAFVLSVNLRGWTAEGLEYTGLEKIHEDLLGMAKGLAGEMARVLDELPSDIFEEDREDLDLIESERHSVARKLRSACQKLNTLVEMDQTLENLDVEEILERL